MADQWRKKKMNYTLHKKGASDFYANINNGPWWAY